MSTKPSPIKYRPTAPDALVAAAVIALGVLTAALFYGGRAQDGALTVVTEINGAVIDRTALDSFGGDRVYEANGYTLTVHEEDGVVSVLSSDCPGQDCVRTGGISRAGQSIVCLPARLVIRLEGSATAPDVIVG